MLSESILPWLVSFLACTVLNAIINELVLRWSGVEKLGSRSADLPVIHCVLRNLEIGMQSQDSEIAQRNLEIAQIPRLRGTDI